MLVYYILVLLPMIIAVYQLAGKPLKVVWKNNKVNSFETVSRKKLAILAFFIIYFIMLAVRRNDVGADVYGYMRHFRNSEYYGFWDYMRLRSNEHAFYGILRLLAYVTSNEQLVLAFFAAATIAPILVFYFKESEHQALTIAMFLILPVFPMFFSGLRQSVAIGLVVLSYYFVKDKKLIPFLIVVITASLFHQSALIAGLLYPIYWMKIKRKMLFWVIPVLAFLYFNNSRVYLFAVAFLGADYHDSYGTVKETGAFMMIILFVLFLVFSYLVLDEKKSDQETLGLRNVLILATTLQFFSMSNPIAARMNYYFVPFLPILIPKIVNRASEQYKKICSIISWVMTVYFIYYFFKRAYTGEDILRTFPYYAFWQVGY